MSRQHAFSPLTIFPRKRPLRRCKGLAAGLLLVLVGCSAYEQRQPPEAETLNLPQQWQQVSHQPDTALAENPLQLTAQTRWVHHFDDPGLNLLLTQVLSQNPGLAEEAARVDSAGAGQVQADAALYPTLDLTGSLSQRQTGSVSTESESVSLQAGFELDLWGKLSARAQESSLNFASARAGFSAATLNLAAETATGWFNLMTQKQLLKLYQRREDTLNNALKVVQQGYNNGIYSAQELHQAENNLQQEQSSVAQQQQLLQEQVRKLQLLLGHYPDGRLLNESGLELPPLPELDLQLLPSELVSRSPYLQQQWLNLLAADAGLAAANRDRFPRLTFSAGVDQNVDWNLVGNLTQPLFNAGRLAAAEEQAAAEVRQREKRYLRELFAAFADVENALMQETTLARRYELARQQLESARQNAALVLSEYQLGLAPLNNLLSAQKSMLDSEARLTELHYQQLANRISLYRLLGGDFTASGAAEAGAGQRHNL